MDPFWAQAPCISEGAVVKDLGAALWITPFPGSRAGVVFSKGGSWENIFLLPAWLRSSCLSLMFAFSSSLWGSQSLSAGAHLQREGWGTASRHRPGLPRTATRAKPMGPHWAGRMSRPFLINLAAGGRPLLAVGDGGSDLYQAWQEAGG